MSFFTVSFFQAFLVRFQIVELQKVDRADICEKFFVLLVVEQYIKIFLAAYAVMVVAFRANEKVILQLQHSTGVFTARALDP